MTLIEQLHVHQHCGGDCWEGCPQFIYDKEKHVCDKGFSCKTAKEVFADAVIEYVSDPITNCWSHIEAAAKWLKQQEK